MVNVLLVMLISFGVFAIGGSIGFFFWIKTRPKKETWTAKVYQIGDGVRDSKLKQGNELISSIKLKDLKPYSEDILEKVEKGPGLTIYRLQKLDKVTPAVTGDVVQYWGKDNRAVNVLFHKGECTLMKQGYDAERGSVIFQPLKHSKVNLIKSEIAIRKERLHKEKDILTAITPWIIAGICIIGLVAISYILGSAYIEISKNIKDATITIESLQDERLDAWKEIESARQGTTVEHDLGVQEEPPPEIPTIE